MVDGVLGGVSFSIVSQSLMVVDRVLTNSRVTFTSLQTLTDCEQHPSGNIARLYRSNTPQVQHWLVYERHQAGIACGHVRPGPGLARDLR